MSWVPKYKVYENDGLTLVHEFEAVTRDSGSPSDPAKSSEIEGIRGVGSLTVTGSGASWDLTLRFHIRGDDYEDLIAKMDDLNDTIAINTKYVLKIDRTSSTTKDYNVMRKTPIAWDEDKRRTRFIFGTITFRVNAW